MKYDNEQLLDKSFEKIVDNCNTKVLKHCAFLDENLNFCPNTFEEMLSPFNLHPFCEKHSNQDSLFGNAVQSARREILMAKPEDLLFMTVYQQEKERLTQQQRKEAIQLFYENGK